MSDRKPLIINAALTGMVPTKAETPHVPQSTEEIARCAREVQEAGASIVHLHARDAEGRPTSDPAAYVELVGAVRDACPDLLTCVSCSGRLTQDVDRRSASLQARPDMASLTLGSLNFPRQASSSPPDVICELARRIYDAGAVPELEVFEPGFAHYAKYLLAKEILRRPCYFNIILGSLGTAPLDLLGLGYIVSLLPEGAVWAAGGIGRFQLDANVMAIAAGGHVRVGIEDNIYYDRDRRRLADNRSLVERVVRIGREMGREPATPDQTRRIIGLPGR
jgi:uncharacterized protein (DUF849 family)